MIIILKHLELYGNTVKIYQLKKRKIIGQSGNDGTEEVEIMVPLKYLSNFWKTLEMSLINCEINLILTWSENCIIISTDEANKGATFAISSKTLCSSSNFINSR